MSKNFLVVLTFCMLATSQYMHAQDKPPVYEKIGYFGEIELNAIEGESRIYEDPAISFATVHGYRIKPWISAGLGIGYDRYSTIDVMPLFLRVSANLTKKHSTPYIFMDGGHGFAWLREDERNINDELQGGWMLQPGIGYMISRGNVAFNIHIGYKFQYTYYSYGFQDDGMDPNIVVEERTRRRATFGVSLIF